MIHPVFNGPGAAGGTEKVNVPLPTPLLLAGGIISHDGSLLNAVQGQEGEDAVTSITWEVPEKGTRIDTRGAPDPDTDSV